MPKNKLSTQVLSVTLSEERWMLVLACGHKIWVTSKRRPKHRTVLCNENHERKAAEAELAKEEL